MKKYDPLKCGRRIVAQIQTREGKLVLFAHHAFKWSVAIENDGRMQMTLMPREKAKREFKRLLKVIQ